MRDPTECAYAFVTERSGGSRRVQAAVAAERDEQRAVHARRPVQDARGRARALQRRAAARVGRCEIHPLDLSERDIEALEAFLDDPVELTCRLLWPNVSR